MKRKIVAVVLASTMVFGMTACGSSGASDSSSTGSDAATDDTATDDGSEDANVTEGSSDDENTLTVWTWDPNFNIYAIEKAYQLGAKPVTCSDSTGWIYDAEGIDLEALKEIKEVKRARLTEYLNYRPNAEYHEGKGVWSVKVDVALPCATQNEIGLEDAKRMIEEGTSKLLIEVANMPTKAEAVEELQKAGFMIAPSKAVNAGGVAVSALEMSQNAMKLSWTEEEVDEKLKKIMKNIFNNIDSAAKKYDMDGNLIAGANIAGFLKVAEAMLNEGIF